MKPQVLFTNALLGISMFFGVLFELYWHFTGTLWFADNKTKTLAFSIILPVCAILVFCFQYAPPAKKEKDTFLLHLFIADFSVFLVVLPRELSLNPSRHLLDVPISDWAHYLFWAQCMAIILVNAFRWLASEKRGA